MTLPSAIAIIVQNFPDPAEQGQALALFGASGAVGNVVGFILVCFVDSLFFSVN